MLTKTIYRRFCTFSRMTACFTSAKNNHKIFTRSEPTEKVYPNLCQDYDDVQIPDAGDLVSVMMNQLTEKEVKSLKVLKLRYDEHYSLGEEVPHMTDARWLHILKNIEYSNYSRVLNYYDKLLVGDAGRENTQIQRVARLARWEDEEFCEERMKSRFTQLQIPVLPVAHYEKKTVHKQLANTRAILSMRLRYPEVVWDCSFLRYMTPKQAVEIATQMLAGYNANCALSEPFHIVMTGLPTVDGEIKPAGDADKSSENIFLKRICSSNWIATETSKSYLDLYPRNRIVYLSHNSKNALREFNHNDVYVIGMLPTSIRQALSIGKARADHVRHAKLPLNHYLTWKTGSPGFNVKIIMNVLSMLQQGEEMGHTLRTCIPEHLWS